MRLAFDVGEPAFRRALERRYGLFLATERESEPDARLAVRPFPPPGSRQPSPFLPRLERTSEGWSFSRGDAACRLDGGGRGTLEVWPNPWSFDAALRVLFARLLAERGAFFLHGAALEAGGRALLFPGPSGAGKSTLVRIRGEREALGDELILVRPNGRGFEACSTPFWGNGKTAPSKLSAPVAGLFFLERRTPGLEPVGAGEARRRLLKCLVWFADESPRGLDRVWTEAWRLADGVPAYRFSFDKRRPPWAALTEAAA